MADLESTVADWAGVAFGPVQSEDEQKNRLQLLDSMQKGSKLTSQLEESKGGNSGIDESDIGTEVALFGRLHHKPTMPGKKQIQKGRGAITFGLLLCESTSSVLKVVVESGIGKENFRRICESFKDYEERGEKSVFVAGVVQKDGEGGKRLSGIVQKDGEGGKLLLCVNNERSHALLIHVITSEYPVFQDMYGAVVTFSSKEDNCHRFLEPFSHAWFYSNMSSCKLSREEESKVSQHVSAYRSSGGGVIYIGAKLEGSMVKNNALKLTKQQLTELTQQIEMVCKDQRPICYHKDWNGRQPPNMIKQQLDWCYTSSFRTNSPTHYIIRVIVCPSKHRLHLSSELDIELRERCGRTSRPYQIADFIEGMSEMEEELNKLSLSDLPCIPFPVVKGQELNLWDESTSEDSYTKNKEGNMKLATDPIKYIIEKMEDYGATWLNSHQGSKPGGTLHIGICDKPVPLITGVWLDKANTDLLASSLAERFKGSLEHPNLCFPPAKHCIEIKKHPVIGSQETLLSKDSNVLVIWLKKKQKPGYHNKAHLLQQVYSLWAEKNCKVLSDVLNTNCHHPPLVVPLNSSLCKYSDSNNEQPDALPIAISPSQGIHDDERNKMVTNLEQVLQNMTSQSLEQVPQNMTSQSLKSFFSSHQFIKVEKNVNLLDPDYCVLEINVTPRENSFHLLKLPKFWKLNLCSADEHIGGVPETMDFHEIVLRCKDSSRAKHYLSTFFQPNDRPILITDVSNHDVSEIEGFARIHWSLVVDFDFGDKQNNSEALKQIFEARVPRPYSVINLPLNKTDQVDLELMSSNPVAICLVKALGPPTDPVKDPTSWVLCLARKLENYIMQACTTMNKVKVLVVWSKKSITSTFVPHVMNRLCSAALEARAEIAVVSPASDILDKFRKEKLPGTQVEEIFLELKDLSEFILSSVYPSDSEISNDIATKHRSIPGKKLLLPEQTVQSMRDNQLDYLYPGIEDDLPSKGYDLGLAFFEGREKFARWEDFLAGNVVNREETSFLKKETKKNSQKTTPFEK